MKIAIGQSASISKTITDKDVEAFADIVGDHNPVHLDEEYAKNTIFGRKIVHGMFGASLISATIGTKLPGNGTIYLNQSLSFKRPVYINDTIEAIVTVQNIVTKNEKLIITLDTICKDSNDEAVIDGQATVLVQK